MARNEAVHIHAFIRANVMPGTTVISDGHVFHRGLDGYRHDPRVVGKMAAHIPLRWIHMVFALLKRWGLGTFHGFRPGHMDACLNEFVFRYNRRYYRHVSFETVLGLATEPQQTPYWDIIGRENPRKGTPMSRRNVRRRRAADGMWEDGAEPVQAAVKL